MASHMSSGGRSMYTPSPCTEVEKDTEDEEEDEEAPPAWQPRSSNVTNGWTPTNTTGGTAGGEERPLTPSGRRRAARPAADDIKMFTDSTGTTYKAGDNAYLDAGSGNYPYCICTIQGFKASRRYQYLVAVKWFYRHSEVPETVYQPLIQDRCKENTDDGRVMDECQAVVQRDHFNLYEVLKEVCVMDTLGLMQDGRLVASAGHQHRDKNIRSDKIAWVEKANKGCANIGKLLTRLDALIYQCRDSLGKYHISGRTQAMVACYPGHGTAYKTHVDNPNRDGRCITCIYYLNKDWNTKEHGGLLRIYPTQFSSKVADVEPIFDRQVFFWSDHRNPHEVQPSFRSRLAVTIWYFDRDEREAAKQKYQMQKRTCQK